MPLIKSSRNDNKFKIAAKANTDECDFMNNVQDCFMKKNVWKAPGFH